MTRHSTDLNFLRQWVDRTETVDDHVSASTVAGMAATLDRSDIVTAHGADVPPLWHWAFFASRVPQSDIGPDGHPKRGGFLPPVPLARRMWAGGRLEFHHPLRVGDTVTRASRIADVNGKEGRSGPLVFVQVSHKITNALGVAITEQHDIVYRDQPHSDAPLAAPQAAPGGAEFSREISPDPVLLFRYSALTFNGHRIHYDRPYVTEVEGYPGLIVHGPLIATLLLDLLQRQDPNSRVRRFSFKAVRPLFDIHPLTVCGRFDDDRRVQLWAHDHEGWLAMLANAELF